MKSTIYWIEGPWAGRLAILPRPRGGDWLEDEVRAWKAAGIDVVVSTLTSDEQSELDLAKEALWCKANGMDYVAFPIVDRGVPSSFRAAAELLRPLEEKLAEGKNIAIHCRQGIGRSALLAGCLLILAGDDPDTAFQRVAAARACNVPETAEQREWAAKFSRDVLVVFRKD